MIWKFVVSDPAVHDGAPVFEGTNVPVHSLLEYRKGDVPVYEFLIDHPAVRPDHAKKVARWMAAKGTESAKAKLDALRRSESPPDRAEQG